MDLDMNVYDDFVPMGMKVFKGKGKAAAKATAKPKAKVKVMPMKALPKKVKQAQLKAKKKDATSVSNLLTKMLSMNGPIRSTDKNSTPKSKAEAADPVKRRPAAAAASKPQPMKQVVACAPRNLKFRAHLTMGTGCSGLDACAFALQAMGLDVHHRFVSDINVHCRSTLLANHMPDVVFDCINHEKDASNRPFVHIYHAGFPCQPFSMAGNRQGLQDPRSAPLGHILHYVEDRAPTVVLLENVRGILTLGKLVEDLCSFFYNQNYDVHWDVLNARCHGVAQNRERFFLVAIKSSHIKRQFSWPTPLQEKSVTKILSPSSGKDNPMNLPPSSQTVARAHVLALRRLLRGQDLSKSAVIADVGSSALHYMEGVSPCITASRGSSGSHWVVCRARRLNLVETEKLFGFRCPPKAIVPVRPPTVSDRQWGKMLGNSIPLPLVGRVLAHALYSAGLTHSLCDVWSF